METNLLKDLAYHFLELYWEWDFLNGRFRWIAPKSFFLGYDIGCTTPNEEWFSSRIHPEDLDRVMEKLRDGLEGKELHWSDTFRFRKYTGGYATLLVKAFFIQDQESQGQLLCGAVYELPKLQTNETEINDAVPMIGKTIFGEMAFQELQRVLGAIGFPEKLFMRPSGDSLEKPCLLEGEKVQLVLLGQHLEQYSSVHLHTPQLEMVDFGLLVAEVESGLSSLVGLSKAAINIEEPMGEVLLDRFLMTVILRSLLRNAIQFNQSAQPVITIKARNSGSDVVFSVTDNGIGVAEQHRIRIFDPFYRVERDSGCVGFGLGLYVAKMAAEKMNGSICCYSKVGFGSTFEVRLFDSASFGGG